MRVWPRLWMVTAAAVFFLVVVPVAATAAPVPFALSARSAQPKLSTQHGSPTRRRRISALLLRSSLPEPVRAQHAHHTAW